MSRTRIHGSNLPLPAGGVSDQASQKEWPRRSLSSGGSQGPSSRLSVPGRLPAQGPSRAPRGESPHFSLSTGPAAASSQTVAPASASQAQLDAAKVASRINSLNNSFTPQKVQSALSLAYLGLNRLRAGLHSAEPMKSGLENLRTDASLPSVRTAGAGKLSQSELTPKELQAINTARSISTINKFPSGILTAAATLSVLGLKGLRSI